VQEPSGQKDLWHRQDHPGHYATTRVATAPATAASAMLRSTIALRDSFDFDGCSERAIEELSVAGLFEHNRSSLYYDYFRVQ
jgi:hypothetical protein